MQFAYIRIPGNALGKRMGIVKYMEQGYYHCNYDQHDTTEEQCQQQVDFLNDRLGVTREVADAMLSGSMFGWHVPAAKAAHDFFGKTKEQQ